MISYVPVRRLPALALIALLVVLFAVPTWSQPVRANAFPPRPAGTVQVQNAFGAGLFPAAAGRLIVQFKRGVTAAQKAGVSAALGGTIMYDNTQVGWQIIQLPLGTTIENARAGYSANPLVQCADADWLCRALLVPNDPYYNRNPSNPNQPYQYAPQLTGCEQAWDITTGSANVVVAIVDSGVDPVHPEFPGRMWVNTGEIPGNGRDDDGNGFVDDVGGWDFVDNDNTPRGDPTYGLSDNHGTHCAGIAAGTGNNRVGIAGVAWQPQIMAVRTMAGGGGWTTDILAGVQYAVDNGANVVNLSLGGGYTQAWQSTIDYAYTRGVVVVAATGNSNHEFTQSQSTWNSPVCNDDSVYPPVLNKIIGVSASDANDLRAVFSNFGSAYNLVDVTAPGVAILSTLDPALGGGEYGTMSGTSMSCPFVVGECGLIRSQNPGWGPDQVVNMVRAGVENIDAKNPGFEGKLGTGRVNVAAALGFDPPPLLAKNVVFMDKPGDEGGAIFGSWSKSGDDGRGWNDVVRYDVLFTSGAGGVPDTLLASLPKGSISIIHEPTDDSLDYYYRLIVYDRKGQATPSPIVGPVRSRDDRPPLDVENIIAQDQPRDGAGGAIVVKWPGYSAQPDEDLNAFNIFKAEEEITDLTGMRPVGTVQATERAFVDTHAVNFTPYWYAVTAVDTHLNESNLTTSVSGQAAPNFVHTYVGGESLVAVGAEPLYTDPSRLLGIDAKNLNWSRWSPTGGRYITYAEAPGDSSLQVHPGWGYFFNQLGTREYDIAGRSATTGQQDVQVQLSRGWNQLGNPFQADLPFTKLRVVYNGQTRTLSDPQVVADRIIRNYAWRYDPVAGSYRLVSDPALFPPGAAVESVIPFGEGFFLFAFQDLTLVLLPPAGAGGASVGGVASRATSGGWQTKVVARTAQGADVDNIIGVGSQAVGSVTNPPPGPSPVDLYFGAGAEGRTAVALKPVGESLTWDFTVECAAANTPVELAWPELSQVPRYVRLVLTDLDTGTRRYLRTCRQYTYDTGATPTPRHFRVAAAGGGQQLAVTGLAASPAGGRYEIVYGLSQPASVDVEVRNIAGVPVCKVLKGALQPAGQNTASWTGRSAAGVPVPAGRYLIELRAVSLDDGQTVRRVIAAQVSH